MSKNIALLVLVLVSSVLFLLGLEMGSSDFRGLLWSFLRSELSNSSMESQILALRFDRSLACFMVGGGLSVSGFLFQNLLKNPLAESFTVGFSGAAALGVSLAVAFGLHEYIWAPVLFGFVFCLITAYLIVGLSQRILRQSSGLILLGICLGFFYNALSLLIQSLLDPHDLHYSFQWMIGSFDSLRNSWWPAALAVNMLLISYVFLQRKQIDLLLLPNESALGLGLKRNILEKQIFFLGALSCGVSVSISGVIAFVGLLGPHLSRKITKRSKASDNLMSCFLTGGSLVLVSDILARLISQNSSVPTGGIIALLGAPFFAFLLLKRSGKQGALP